MENIGRPRLEDTINIDLNLIELDGVHQICIAKNSDQWRSLKLWAQEELTVRHHFNYCQLVHENCAPSTVLNVEGKFVYIGHSPLRQFQ